MRLKISLFVTLLLSFFLGGCATSPPQNPDNICDIFEEHHSWYEAADDMNEKWGVPVNVPLAMMYQESAFKHDAAPPMEYFLWIIPIGRASNAYGYAQAMPASWSDYVEETGNSWASRDDFDDAIDFMGWFINKTHKVNGISKSNARAQYLNYHEGWTGYRRGSYKSKSWLINVANKVDSRSRRYASQYKQCEEDLGRSWLWRLFFG